MTRLMTRSQRPATLRHRTSLFEEAVEIVEAEFERDITLDEVARRVACSRRQLQRSYAEIGQTTFREHMATVRMQRAAELLRSPTMTIREIARRVGYRQPAQFAKAFRRQHAVSPSDYRRRAARSMSAGELLPGASLLTALTAGDERRAA